MNTRHQQAINSLPILIFLFVHFLALPAILAASMKQESEKQALLRFLTNQPQWKQIATGGPAKLAKTELCQYQTTQLVGPEQRIELLHVFYFRNGQVTTVASSVVNRSRSPVKRMAIITDRGPTYPTPFNDRELNIIRSIAQATEPLSSWLKTHRKQVKERTIKELIISDPKHPEFGHRLALIQYRRPNPQYLEYGVNLRICLSTKRVLETTVLLSTGHSQSEGDDEHVHS